jgi:radical SAM superfamily enzyme YgiQ (UPF0313 family)
VPDVLMTHSYHLPNDPKQLRKMRPYPPLGTLYAASALTAAGISVAVFDSMLIEPRSGFIQSLDKHKPTIVAIYEDDFNFVTKMCLTHMREVAQELARVAHAKGITVIAHGSDATDHPEEYLRHGVDYVLNGEAEQTLTELCSLVLQNRQPENIPGLIYQAADGGIIRTTSRPPKNPAWVNLPAIDRSLIDLAPYRRLWTEAHGYFSTNLVSSRGCPYRCNWCAKPISGDKYQLRRPEAVAAELRALKEDYGVDHIWFGDDVFALNHHWIAQFATEIESIGGGIPFKIQSRADLLSESTVTNLKRAGCAEIWMGVESGSQKVLDAMDKGLSLADVQTARERLAKVGIRACYFLQFGYPGENWDDILETVRLIRTTRPDDIGVSLSYPLPGTRFYDRVRAQLGSKHNWKDSDDLCTIFTATYTDEFYRAIRDALHAEVTSWRSPESEFESASALESQWQRIFKMEPTTRNPHAISFQAAEHAPSSANGGFAFVSLDQFLASSMEV